MAGGDTSDPSSPHFSHFHCNMKLHIALIALAALSVLTESRPASKMACGYNCDGPWKPDRRQAYLSLFAHDADLAEAFYCQVRAQSAMATPTRPRGAVNRRRTASPATACGARCHLHRSRPAAAGRAPKAVSTAAPTRIRRGAPRPRRTAWARSPRATGRGARTTRPCRRRSCPRGPRSSASAERRMIFSTWCPPYRSVAVLIFLRPPVHGNYPHEHTHEGVSQPRKAIEK